MAGSHTLLLLVIASLAATACITPAQSTRSESLREFKVPAQKYDSSADIIKVKRGDHVRLNVTALDAEHGFKLEGRHIERKLPKGVILDDLLPPALSH